MNRPRQSRAKNLAVILFFWLTAGFSIGTGTLLGPARWTASHARSSDWSQTGENCAIVAIIALVIGVSGLLAFRLARLVLRTQSRLVRWGWPLALVLSAAWLLHLWLNPSLLSGSAGGVTEAGPRFTFGPYPDEKRLRELEAEGYTAVISLLHPAVVPFEPMLIADEERAARRVGIELRHVPMLPWISDNAASIEEIRKLAAARTGRFYVHCYLGMDRIQLVRRVVEQVDPAAKLSPQNVATSLRGVLTFERGSIEELEDGVFLTPMPTESEILRFVLPTGVKQVVCLLDPRDPDDAIWIAKERAQLATLALPFDVLPIPDGPDHDRRLGEVVRAVRGMPRPVIVHAFFSPATGKAPSAAAFAKAYRETFVSQPKPPHFS